jgi:putative zinc finger/helix-turn-helix YgiT family protein
MTHDPAPKAQRAAGERPFPWRCPKCLKKEVYLAHIPYTAEVAHDGRSYTIAIPELHVPRCRACGELVFGSSADDQIMDALRAHVRLLKPQQIRNSRKALGLSQQEMAERLGVAEATISRWETGGLIQSRAMDNLLRAYFALPELRAVLLGSGQDPDLGTTVAQGRTAG